jgi:hypothetical protein
VDCASAAFLSQLNLFLDPAPAISPKGQRTQPTMKTVAQLSLDQTIGEISAQNSSYDCGQDMPGLKDGICHR